MFSATSSLVIIALMALGNILPKQRQIIHDITGVSPIILGLLPVSFLLVTFLCSEDGKPSEFSVSEATLDVPLGGQLLAAAVLLGIFAAAVGEDDQDEKTVQLVKADRIAKRLACAAGALGVLSLAVGNGQITASMWSGLPKANTLTSQSFFTSQNFASPEAALEVPESFQLLAISALLFIFKMAISEDLEETKGKVKLVRADAIAFRFSLAASLWGIVKLTLELDALAHVASFFKNSQKMLPSSPTEGFGQSEVTLDVSEGAQLLILSALLFVFKMAVNETHASKDTSTQKKKESTVQLVRADAIAFRLSLAAALWGIAKIMPGVWSTFCLMYNEMLKKSSATEFGKSEATIEVSEGLQLFTVSALIFVWKMVISDSEKTEEPLDENKDLKEPEKEQIQKEPEKEQIQLVCAKSIASRFAVVTMVLGCLKLIYGDSANAFAWGGFSQAVPTKQATLATFMHVGEAFPTSPKAGFASSDVVMDVPEGMQFIMISVLVLMFKLAIDSDEKKKEEKDEEKAKVQLVSASRIALRLAVAAGIYGFGKMAAPAMTSSLDALMNSGELLAKGGMLGASTGLVLWSAHKQSQNLKM